eukprot:2716628-Amphidinium_carterae.1
MVDTLHGRGCMLWLYLFAPERQVNTNMLDTPAGSPNHGMQTTQAPTDRQDEKYRCLCRFR